MSNNNINSLINMFKSTKLNKGVVRQTAKLSKKSGKLNHYAKNVKSTANRKTLKKGVKAHGRANLISARRKRQAATAKAAKAAKTAAAREKKEYNERVEREKVTLQGRTRAQQKELSKNQEMK
jgi:hypothetical protein